MLFLNIPKNIDITVGNNWFKIVGPLGEVTKKKSKNIKLYFDKTNRKLYLLTKDKQNNFYLSLLNKIIWGLCKGFTCKLSLVGIGYKVEINSTELVFKLGYSHNIYYNVPEDIAVSLVPKQKNLTILIKGNNYQKVKQVAAELRALKSPEPYKGKGIRYFNEIIIQKQGKKN